MTTKLTLQDLEDRYPDPEFRRSFFDLMNLSGLLTDSIIKKDYIVPPGLHAQIALTEYGEKIYDQLRRRNNVPYHEARLLCFLEMYHADLIIDVNATDQDEIVRILSKQVADRSLMFPFVFGRLLYDKYFDEYEDDPKRYLNPEETNRLLLGTPQGVAQFARLVTGPYGILSSRSSRMLHSSRQIPLRHCSDVSCTTVHHVLLSTSMEASINKHREALGKVLEHESSDRAWRLFVRAISADHIPEYQDWASEPIVFLIGDALADAELSKLFKYLLDHGDGHMRTQLTSLSLAANAPFNRAELLQLILTEDSDAIVYAVDSLIRKKDIRVPDGEIRTPVVNKGLRYGSHELYAELGEYGVRVRSTGSSLAPLRARQLVEQMYRLDEESDRQELDWQMRDEPIDSIEAKLEHYLQTRPPRHAMGNLVLARRANVVVATATLRLGDSVYENDDDLISAVLWKLGFSLKEEKGVNAEFWNAHQEMHQKARRGLVSANPADREEIRQASATYFTSLESLLDDSLAYTIWALTTDHYMSTRPFIYRPGIDRMQAFKRLNDFGPLDGKERLGNKNTLYPLTRGFARLELYLQGCEARREELRRSVDEYPEWVSVQSLERFPFVHTVAYLDLMSSCRESIRRVLREVTARFASAGVSETRNEWLHGQRSISMESQDRLREGIDDVAEAVHHLEENGMTRQRYTRISDIVDGDHRRTVTLASPDGRQVSLFGPSPFAWLRLPGLAQVQYIMNSARFAEPAESLRFTVEVDSPYSKMWEKFPRRPRLQRGRTVAGRSALPMPDMHS